VTLGRVAGRAAGEVATVLAIRMSVALLGAIAALAGVLVLYGHSMRSSQWGPYLPGESAVTIERYSTPWLIGATGLALLAGLLVVAAVADFVRWRRVRRAARRERS
jgi:fructose 1,6-bisphosphatase